METRIVTRLRPSTSSRSPAAAKKSRPGGRTEKNRQAVAGAVLELIKNGKVDFEIQEVAALSGVHRTTVFRRWPSRDALIAEALTEHNSRITIEITGDWEADFRRMALSVRDFLADPVEQAMNRTIATTESAQFRDQSVQYWMPIVQSCLQPILAARASGDIDLDVDAEIVVNMLVSTLLIHTMFLGAPPDDAMVERVVAQLLKSCRLV
jgi:AcrR family transcriptional regulator